MSARLSGEVIHALRQQGMGYRAIGEVIAEMQGRKIRYTDMTIGKVYRAWLREQAQRTREASGGNETTASAAGDPPSR